MPSAEKKNSMDKQAGMENVEPIKQAQIVIEHKIRNIEKRKRKIENYKDDQAKGQVLNADQLLAVSKYEEVCKTLEFAQDLVKQFGTIAVESGKQQKKLARKEALDRAVQETAKIKEILLIQDLLKTMGIEAVREDFLAGQNKAVVLTEEELQFLDDFYVEVSPERMAEEDEGYIPFDDQAQSAAEHLLALVESRQKEVAGTTYVAIKELIGKIQASGYLEARAQVAAEEPALQVTEGTEPLYTESTEDGVSEQTGAFVEEYYEEPVEQAEAQQEIPQEIIQQDLTPEPAIQAQPVANPPVHRTVSELIDPVTAPFNFLQDSELEAEPVPAPLPSAPVGPIPTQMYVNQSFATAPAYAPAGYPPQPPAAGNNNANPPPPIPMPPSRRTASPFQRGQAYATEQPAQGYQVAADYKQQVAADAQDLPVQQPAGQPTLEQGDWSLETEDTGATGDWIQPPNNRNNYAARSARPSNYQNNRGGGGGGGYNSYPRNDNSSYKNGYGSQREGGGGGGGNYGGQREGGGNYGNSNYGGGGGNRPRGGQRGGGQTGGGGQQYGGGRGNRGYGGGGGGYTGQQRQASRGQQ